MQPSDSPEYRKDIGDTYASMSNDELLDVAMTYDSLTPQAQSLLRDEFKKRKLEPPEIPDAAEATSQDLVNVRRYADLTEALIAKSLLESAGIICYLRDEKSLQIVAAWSQRGGWIRLDVGSADAAQAEELLTQPLPPDVEE